MTDSGSAKSSTLRSIVGTSGVRVVSGLVALATVPLLLSLVGKTDYGVWVTLTSLLVWIGILDLGVGNSLRNSVAGMISPADRSQVQSEFIALFRLLAAVALAAILLLALALPCFELLGRSPLTSLTLYVPYLLMLPLLLAGSVLQGAGNMALLAAFQATAGIGFILFLVICHLLSWRPGLEVLGLAYSLAFVLSVLATFARARELLGLRASTLWRASGIRIPTGRLRVGASFLILQIASIVLYGIGNLIVYTRLGPAEVARYDVVNKIFQIGLGFYSIVISVMWTEISRRKALGEFAQLRTLHGRMMLVALAFSAGALLVAVLMPWFVRLWTHGVVVVATHEAMAIGVLVSVQAVAYVGAVFMNAFERVSLQVVLSLVAIALMLPLSHLFLARGAGVAAVPMAAAVLTSISMLVCNSYARNLLRRAEYAAKGCP